MLSTILQLEENFNNLLPKGQQKGVTPKPLKDAGTDWSKAVWNFAKHANKISYTQQQITDALQFSQRAIFICGSERSGTTLVRNLLDGHPQLSVLPSEGTYITHQEKKLMQLTLDKRGEYLCRVWLWRLVLSMHQPPFWLLGRSTINHSPYVEFARAFISWWNIIEQRIAQKNSSWPFIVVQLAFASSQNKINDNLKEMFWVEKTPNNEKNLSRLWKEFPQAKIIQTIRNPVDILKSCKPNEAVSTISSYSFMRTLRTSFLIATKQVQKKDNRYLVVRYEDLCENPQLLTTQIASFIGIRHLPCLLIPTTVEKSTEANSSFKQKNIAGKIIRLIEHKQEDNLTKKDYNLLSANLYQLTEPFGYHLQPIGMFYKRIFEIETFVKRAFNKTNKLIFSNRKP